jgi:peptidoglycan hydrolase-like protein with peptidoglycan-binding domain
MAGGPEHPLLELQRTAGNRAVTQLLTLQRDCGCSCGGGPGCKGAAAERAEDEGVQRAVAAPEVGSSLLVRGSKGPAVAAAQRDLNALGATPQLDTDSSFGSRTEAAVKFFQLAHRLVPDGILGPVTATMLRTERANEPVNFLVPCHTPEKPGPAGHEERALDEQERSGGGGNLFGEPGAGQKVNLTLVLTGTAQDRDEAAAVGGKIVQVGSLAALQAVLDQHPNIGNLAIISHGGIDGTVVIGGANVFLKDLAAALSKRAAGSIERVQFLGCNIGRDPTGMGALKAQTGAGAVEGTNCFLETQRLLPARRGGGKGAEILTRKDLPASSTFPGRPMSDGEFGAILKELIPKHVDVNGAQIKRPDCILGLPPGNTLATVPPEKLAELYFLRRGNLVFRSVPGGACWEDLKFDKAVDGCKRVQV